MLREFIALTSVLQASSPRSQRTNYIMRLTLLF